MRKEVRDIILKIAILLVVWVISMFVYERLDLTSDKRYTLTETSHKIISEIKSPLQIDLFLGGELTGNYKILKNEISFLLDELKEENKNINYNFLTPNKDITPQELESAGLAAVPIKTDNGFLNIYPYARLSYEGKQIWMEVLVNDPSVPFEQLALASTEKLEYLFMEDIQRITKTERKKIGFIVHHDELPEKNIDGFGRALADKYDVEVYLNPIVDSSYSLKEKDLENLKKFDALIVAKPTLPFTEMDKLVLDQYIMNGGRMIWAVEAVDAEMDSIFRSGKILAFPRDLKLNDFFFNYGVRIHPAIIKDLDGAKIVLADGEIAGNVSYNYYTWPYFELGTKGEENPITKTIDPVEFQFANPIELLENPNIKQTVLLSTTESTFLKSAMNYISLDEVNPQDRENYVMGKMPIAVLLEGNFNSAYQSRYERKEFKNFKGKTVDGKMIVISDGDIMKNSLWRGVPMRLGEDKYSVRPDNPNSRPNTYANQAFLMNSIDYLLGEEDFLFLRNRKLEIPLLSESKVQIEKKQWQWKNILIPSAVIWSLGAAFIFLYYKRRFVKQLLK